MTARRLVPHLLAALALLALAAAAPAAAVSGQKTSCGRQVFADWWDNDRVDRPIYPLHCYRDAIRMLSEDMRVYSGAEQDILRALAYAQQGRRDPGDRGRGSIPSAKPEKRVVRSETPDVTPPVDTSGPSSVPIPLIVLGSIAGLLLVLGAAGHFKRRLADRNDDL
jgi:hypothetical protein